MASVAHEFVYDVFLSFRGEDTRHGFTGNLWKALDDKGVRTFMDDGDLRKGDVITKSLLQAIEESKIAIVVLSKNYASSSFCLDELSKILDSMKDKADRSVLPIFYKVDPSDIRKLKKTYGEAMTKHMENSNPNIDKWKASLNQVAELSGFHYNKRDMYEHEFIEKIVEEVLKKITLGTTLHVGDYVVGLEPQQQCVISLLNVETDDKVHMVGIHGIGGIGKTTLALAVFNLIAHQFEGSCFIENVRENSEKHGLPYLQNILLSKVVGKKIESEGVRQGISMIQQRLRQKKFLLVLDDVNELEQLQAIAGKPNWFGLGSRVIVTTRNQRLLTLHGIERTYEVKELNNKDAFELVRWNAFKHEKTDKVFSGYVHVLERAIAYASGLPLALEVIGSHFSNRTIEECKCALDQCERVLDKKIQMTLQLSFDALEKEEKFVFLDIACCFKGCKLTKVEQILHAHHGYSIKNHINVLVEKSLIKISNFGDVTLHDLIEDMGKDIVKQESPNPWERSRLWDSEDVNEVLEENKEASKIGIIYINKRIEFERCFDGEAFNKMENLKTLLIHGWGFDGRLKHLPNSLRVLVCRSHDGLFLNKKFQNMKVLNLHSTGFQFSSQIDLSNFPNLEELSIENWSGVFRSDKSVCFLSNLKILRIRRCRQIKSVPPLDCPSLVELYLSYCSSLESFPLKVNGFVGNLKICSLQNCSTIRIIPLNMLHSLEELNLDDCTSLESFSHVVGLGEKLKTMSVRNCIKLRSIPPLKLTSLEELDLSNCTNLQNFPCVVDEFLGKLKILRVENCHNLKIIPPLKLDVLEELDLSNCYMLESFLLSVGEFLGKAKTLCLAGCHNIKSIPPLKLDSLEKLDLSNCTSLESFPHVVGLGEKLKNMSVRSCIKLKSIPPLKLTSLKELDLSYCTSLESFPPVVDGFLGKLKTLLVTSCHNLRSIPPLKLDSLEELDLSCCYSLESFPSVVDGLLDKLKFLNIGHCIMLKIIPPLRLTSLEKFNLSYCLSLESFPKILGEIRNIPELLFYGTPIKVFPFRNLTPPPTSYPCKCGIVQLPNRVAAMSMLAEFTIMGEGKVIPMQSSHVEYICLRNCKLSDEYLSTSLMLFANVKELHLTNNQFTVLPKSIEKCNFLWRLVLDDCEDLQEIKGIPPCLRMLSALNCQSLTSSSKSKLLNQELHEVGNTWFRLPRAKIPEWFDHQCSEGLSVSFWFRNKFPDILLCVGSPLTWFPNHQHRVRVIINGITFFYRHGLNIGSSVKKMYHLHLFHMQMENFNDNIDKALLENKWNHAEVDFGFAFQESGIHVLKDKSNMKDIRFNDSENDANIVLHPRC